ncbi:MAG: hypothetical protein JW755_04650 [Candidatus Aminicenantes bacterium]|nr:hypothetical protein [Candidatus Aminicenantes bacterium]
MLPPVNQHPVDPLLNREMIPSIWCSGCGIGIVLNTFLQVIGKLEIDPEDILILSSGLGCLGKIPELLRLETLSVQTDEIISQAEKIRKKKPGRKVVVFLNDTDFMASGADSFFKEYPRDLKIIVIYVNSFLYNLFVEQKEMANTPFSKSIPNLKEIPNKQINPFNLPDSAAKSGAILVSRWTPLHVRRFYLALKKAFDKNGFSFIEIISPCLMYFASDGRLGHTLDRMKYFLEKAVIKNGEPTENLDTRNDLEIIIGNFVDL